MRNGNLEQFDTPETIYQKPATRFVAAFVTQANILPATRNANLWDTEIGRFEDAVQSPDGKEQPLQADLMIRQEDLRLEPDEAGALVIHDRQFLGREHRYYLLCASGRELHARLPADKAIPTGTRVNVHVTASALQVFPSA